MAYTLDGGVDGVRLATKADEDQIFGLFVMLHGESSPFSMNADKVREGIRLATERTGGLIGVIECDHRIVAVIFLVIANDWYSDDCHLYERAAFVHPDYRKSDYAKKLIEFGKWASDWFSAHGAPMAFFCGIRSTVSTAAKVRLYGRQMLCVGANFIYGKVPRRAAMERISRAEEAMSATKGIQPAVREVLRLNVTQEAARV